MFAHADAKAGRYGVLKKQRELVKQKETVCVFRFIQIARGKMSNQYFNADLLDKQEPQVVLQTQEMFGKGRHGFCDFSLDGIDLLLYGIHHLRNLDKDTLDETGEFKNHKLAMRSIVYYNLYHTSLTYKAVYNLIHQGYYTESAILLRSIVENLVRMKYLYKQKDIDLVNTAFAGHYGYKGKKFKVKYQTMFDSVAPGLYEYYRLLCDIAHGSFAAHMLKIGKRDSEQKKIILDYGLIFKLEESTYVINQFSVYLFAHIKFMMLIFPEIEKNMTRPYANKYHKTISKLEAMMKIFAEKEQNKKWYGIVKQLLDNN